MVSRKTSKVPSRVWTYGCLAPTQNGEKFFEQLHGAHRYQNNLIELERWRRNQYRAERAKYPDLAPLEAAYDELTRQIDARRDELNRLRSAERKRVESPELKRELQELGKKRREAKVARDEARRKVEQDPALVAFSTANNAAAVAKHKELRASCGVYWGSYLLIERAVDAARKSLIDPEFKRWDGCGLVGVQLHRESLDEVMNSQGTMIQIDPLHIDMINEGWSRNSMGGFNNRSAKRHAHTKVRIRIGSDENKRPIWVELPVLLHRLPPPGAVITWAWIKVTREGLRNRYELQLTIESPSFARASGSSAIVALDFGWRVMPTGTRVGFAVDDKGKTTDFILPNDVTRSIQYASHLRSVGDLVFDQARAVMKAALQHPNEEGTAYLPPWVLEACEHIDKWRSHVKLARVAERYSLDVLGEEQRERLWREWKRERLTAVPKLDLFDTEAEICNWLRNHRVSVERADDAGLAFYLDLWRRKDAHIYQWEVDQRNKALRRRKDLYRNWAAQLTRQYGTILLEAFDLRAFTRNAKPEEDAKRDHTHAARTLAAPSMFRLAIKSAGGSKNRIEDVDPENSTRECHHCGHVNDWAAPDERVQQCGGCAQFFDQDENAARNFMRRWAAKYGAGGGERSGGGEKSGGARGSIKNARKPARSTPRLESLND